jgi:hypothetical protein
MAYQKLQVSNGLAVIPSDTVRIPNPDTEVLSGAATGTTADKLVVSTATFESSGIQAGKAIIYNTTDSTCAYVAAIDSDTVLSLSADIMASGENFVIYNEATIGCVLFAGVAGDIGIQLAQQNASGDTTELTFKGIAAGAFLPTQAIRVDATKTTATDIIALW